VRTCSFVVVPKVPQLFTAGSPIKHFIDWLVVVPEWFFFFSFYSRIFFVLWRNVFLFFLLFCFGLLWNSFFRFFALTEQVSHNIIIFFN
jgi:hypothetical protein